VAIVSCLLCVLCRYTYSQLPRRALSPVNTDAHGPSAGEVVVLAACFIIVFGTVIGMGIRIVQQQNSPQHATGDAAGLLHSGGRHGGSSGNLSSAGGGGGGGGGGHGGGGGAASDSKSFEPMAVVSSSGASAAAVAAAGGGDADDHSGLSGSKSDI
jgi:hypothetical protein